jgi:protein phosphatase
MFDGLEVDSFGCSDVGKVRGVNEDQFLVAALHKVTEIAHTSIPEKYRRRFDSGARALLLLVADGVGGAAGGEEASSITLDSIVDYVTNSMRCFYKMDEQLPEELLRDLALSIQRSHTTVRSEAGKAPGHGSMATTLTMAHVLWPRVYVVQIGDSRCYHLRGPALVQVTKDQTLVQELVDEGVLSAEDAKRSPFSNVLAQAIGADEPEISPVISRVDLERGDAVILCTDGLTQHVSDEEIGATLTTAASAQGACEKLLNSALDRGGTDNVTVVVSRFS